MTLLEQSSGLKVTLHAGSAQVPKVSASLRPKVCPTCCSLVFIPSLKDVSVFVVSTTSSNSSPITNYTFQAIVPKVRPFMLQLFFTRVTVRISFVAGMPSQVAASVGQ
jgi:hypothetical protein